MRRVLCAGGPTSTEMNLPCRNCGGTQPLTYTKRHGEKRLRGRPRERQTRKLQEAPAGLGLRVSKTQTPPLPFGNGGVCVERVIRR